MSLFGAIQLGGNTLRAMQIGLHVVGNNIANANTPGYVRQEAVYVPAPVMRQGNLILGLGVQVDSIIQKLDQFVLERLANMAIELVATACVLARTQGVIAERGEGASDHELALCDLFCVESGRRFRANRLALDEREEDVDQVRRRIAEALGTKIN